MRGLYKITFFENKVKFYQKILQIKVFFRASGCAMPTSLDPLRGTSAQEAIEKEESTPDLTRFLLSLLFLFLFCLCM